MDICGSSLETTYARKMGANWNIERAVGDIDGGGFATSNVTVGAGVSRFPDIACAGGRVFVAWFHREGTDHRLHVSHARRADGIFALSEDLGLDGKPFFKRSLAVAGVNDTSYVAFRPQRRQAAAEARASPGARATSSWTTRPASATSGRARTASPSAGNASSSRTGSRPGQPGLDRDHHYRNDFGSFRDRQVTSRFQEEHLVGYVTAAGKARLAAAFDTGNRVRFRRQR
ncbi:hypothetical protein BH23CHL8_BH23CHL8_12570 [soil metagenome]